MLHIAQMALFWFSPPNCNQSMMHLSRFLSMKFHGKHILSKEGQCIIWFRASGFICIQVNSPILTLSFKLCWLTLPVDASLSSLRQSCLNFYSQCEKAIYCKWIKWCWQMCSTSMERGPVKPENAMGTGHINMPACHILFHHSGLESSNSHFVLSTIHLLQFVGNYWMKLQ